MKDEITKYLHNICKNAMNEDDPYEVIFYHKIKFITPFVGRLFSVQKNVK